MRAHYDANREKYLQKAIKHRTIARNEAHDFICDYFIEHPCVDCGEADIVVLQFDHCRGTKIMPVSSLISRGWLLAKIREEVEKCDVVCANCHARRTANQFGWWRLAPIA